MKSNKSPYINVLYSMMGVVFNMIIPIVVFPYVARVLGVDGIGKYSFYSSIFTYFALFTGFGIALYGTREIGKFVNDLQRRNQTFIELIIINLITVSISAIFVFYFAFFSSYSNDCLIILLFCITLLTNAIGAEWFFVGVEMQGFMLIRNIVFKSISTALVFIIVTEPEHLARYVAIVIFSQAGTSLTNIYYLSKMIKLEIRDSLKLKKHLKPLFSIFSIEILLRYLSLGDVVILGVLMGDNAVGIYSMGLKVFLLVSSILKVTATTLMPRSAYYLDNNNNDGFYSLLSNTIRMLFLVGLPISAFIFIFAEPLILLLGGGEFENSIGLMKEMSLFLLLSVLINTFVFQALYPLNKVKTIIVAHIIGILVNIILNCVLVPMISYHGTFIAFAVSNIVIAGVLVMREWIFFKTCYNIKDYINYIIATIGATISIYLLEIFVCRSWDIILSLLFVFVYIVILQLLKDKIYLNIRNIVICKLKWK